MKDISEVDDILSRDYNERGLIMLARSLEKQRNEARRELKDSSAELRCVRLILAGLCDEKLELKVTLSPAIFDQHSVDAVQYLVKHHAKEAAHMIEQKIGGPLRRLQEALMHIHYLENHALHNGLLFVQWAVTERDKELYY